jgi:hypothetical protein
MPRGTPDDPIYDLFDDEPKKPIPDAPQSLVLAVSIGTGVSGVMLCLPGGWLLTLPLSVCVVVTVWVLGGQYRVPWRTRWCGVCALVFGLIGLALMTNERDRAKRYGRVSPPFPAQTALANQWLCTVAVPS